MKYLFISILFFLWSFTGYGQTAEKKIIDFYADTSSQNRINNAKKENLILYADTTKNYLIKTKEDKNNSFQQLFRKDIRRQLSASVYIAAIHNAADLDIKKQFAEYTIPANNNWKLSPALLTAQEKLLPEKKYIFLIQVNDSISFSVLINKNSKQAEIKSYTSDAQLFRVSATLSFIKNVLLPSDYVLNIDLRTAIPKEETVIVDFDNSVDEINQLHSLFPDYTGNNLTVSIKENLFDTTDIDFTGRYKPTSLSSPTTTAHATIMGTLIGGGGNSFYTGKGVATSCKISSSSFAVLLPDANSDYLQYSISVQNHSYGVGIENFYGSDAAAYDTSMIVNPNLLHIFSAGNFGDLASAGGQYSDIAGYANLSGSFKMAKNIITVGSVDSFYNIPALSSKGPAYDGRVKPELVAYGNDGSSGAAAITSGTALAIQDRYSQEHSGALPANALVKAILINSADDVGSTGIDFISGYGCVNAFKAAGDISAGKFFNGTVSQDEIKNFSITIPPNVKNLKVSLVWDDMPAQANAFTALVNDLDLSLEKNTTAQTWLPWVLNSSPNIDSLQQLPKRMRDSLNVVEQISLDNPAPGDYTIHVKGFDIPAGPQSFYIAYRWDTLNTFHFTFPVKGDHFTSGEKNIFRLKNNYTATAGKLEYSTDKGSTWKLIDAAADISKPYYQWDVPDTFSIALARITIGTDVYTTDTFNFSKQLYPQVGFNCTDSVLLYWNKAPGLNSYRLFQLGAEYLEPFTTLTDTTIIIHNPASSYYAVAPLFSNNDAGVNSYTFNYSTQGVECYIKNFLADLQTDNTALLQFELGSLYNVSKIIFQKQTTTGWKDLQTVQPVTNLQNNYTDNELNEGPNTYRAILQFNNGASAASIAITIYYFSNKNYLLFPNPVQRGQKLTILSNDFSKSTLLLYDLTGRKVLQQTLSNTREDVNISQLAKGMYLMVILKDNAKLFTGKILVE